MSQEQPNSPQQPAHSGEHAAHPGYGAQGYNPYGQYGNPYQHYGYNGEYASGGHRTIRDYLMIIRERVWYLILAIFICTTGAMLYNQSVEPEYRAEARFQIYRNRTSMTSGMSGTDTDVQNRMVDDRDFTTKIGVMQSNDIIRRVSKRLSQDERNEALAPYQKGNIFSGPLSPEEVIARCRSIQPERQSFIAKVWYTHPNKDLAQKMADYFVQEILRANEEETSQIVDPLVERLKIQTDQLQQEIQDLGKKKNDLVEREKILTLTKEMSVATAELSQLSTLRESDKRAFEEATANRDQLIAYKANNQPTGTIPFIAKDERVGAMSSEVAKVEIMLSSQLKSYTEKHPKIIALQQQLAQSRIELNKAVIDAEGKLEATYQTAKVNYENSKNRYAAKETELTNNRKAYTEYDTIEKEIKNKEDIYTKMYTSYQTEKAKQAGLAGNPIRQIDASTVSDRPVNKNTWLALAGGLGLGSVIGLGLVFLLSALDDRVKSATDIEQFVGIPLIGVIPKITKLDNFRRARTVSNNGDRATTESFHAIYSALKIHDQARNAKAILTTSTTPSEGKSFFTTNLAMTYAMHGEKVIVVDADLRLPNVGKSLQITGDAGITQYQAGMITLDEAIRKDVVPNLDVLPVGASCKNPTQVLNSKRFAAMIEELKGRYDRVFIDSPPVGAVSDALNLMPQVDGALYVVKFNTVHRKSIKGNLRRLRESKVPVFGAVLNQIGLHVANYYTSTYDKAYNKYYHDTDPHAVEVDVK